MSKFEIGITVVLCLVFGVAMFLYSNYRDSKFAEYIASQEYQEYLYTREMEVRHNGLSK